MTNKLLMPPISWSQLIGQLECVIKSICPVSGQSSGGEFSLAPEDQGRVSDLLERYISDRDDFKQHVRFSSSGYTKNLVTTFTANLANVIVMCWAPSQASAFHAHEGSRCFVKVLQGRLIEERLPHPKVRADAQVKLSAPDLQVHKLRLDDVAYIDDSVGCHRVTNDSHSEPAITLHVYVPPYEMCRVFDLQGCDQEESQHMRLSMDKSKAVKVFK